MPTAFEQFIAAARGLRGDFFDSCRPITAARAPGWTDLLGGAAAPAGALALGWPLGVSACVAAQPDPEPHIVVRDESGEASTLPLAELVDGEGLPRPYAGVSGALARRPPYQRLAGAAWLALMREEFVLFPGGARLLVRPHDGPGAMVSLLAAMVQALVGMLAVRVAPRELGLVCQTALQRLVQPAHAHSALGPLVSVCAPADALLLLHPQPAWIWGYLHLPPGTAIWAVRVGEGPGPGPPTLTRIATAMAYRLAAEAEDLAPADADARWQGYLANLDPDRFERHLRDLLPARVRGRTFRARYGPLPGLALDLTQSYPVRASAALAVDEHLRGRLALALLRAAASKDQRDDDLSLVGELMLRSHWAQRAAGHGDVHADHLVSRVYGAGLPRGLYGARAATAESGATVVVLGRAEAEAALRSIAERYAAEVNLPVRLSGGSVSGSSVAGSRQIS
ncbi:MAG: hypothetical protein SNJ69_04190 [Chloroflexaceae bacterium]